MKNSKIKKNSAAYFDRLAQTDFVIDEPVKCYQEVMDRLARIPFETLADIGCGTGEILQQLEQIYGTKVRLSGIDLSEKSLQKAGEKCSADLKIGDAESLPYEDASFDVLLCMHSFHHYPDPQQALSEMHRVLKPEGILLLVDNNFKAVRRILANLSYRIFGHSMGDVRLYTDIQLKTMAEEAAFKVLCCDPVADHSQLLECVKQETAGM